MKQEGASKSLILITVILMHKQLIKVELSFECGQGSRALSGSTGCTLKFILVSFSLILENNK